MLEPTPEDIKELIDRQAELNQGKHIKNYHSSRNEQSVDDVNGLDLDIELTELKYEPMRPRNVMRKFGRDSIISQISLYQVPILGVMKGEPIIAVPAGPEFIYMPIGITGKFGTYTHDMQFVELRRNIDATKKYVSVFKDTNNRIIGE